ncbi:MAG: ribosomal protein S18-alanine N-acetyltransferase [Lachnospiraceae bacterium]|nr:ribosomal protein S18-alanine N-acetyltransferase [Lachnospiraceae bacterium]
MSEIVIRELRDEDIDEVCRMEEESFSMPWHRESFEDMIRNPNALYIVAVEDGIVCGAAGLLAVVGEGDICNIVVDKAHRSKGIGSKLVAELIRLGRRDYGIGDLTLEVRVSNETAIHMYEKAGFRSEGVRPHFYDEPDEDALIMWLRSQ